MSLGNTSGIVPVTYPNPLLGDITPAWTAFAEPPADAPASSSTSSSEAPVASTDLPPATDVSSLSPDALMAYCQSRLDSIQTQVQGIFQAQETGNNEIAGIQSVLATFQANAGGVNGGDQQGPQKCADMTNALHGLIVQIQNTDPGCAVLGTLIQTYNNLVYTGTGPTAAPYIDKGEYPPDTGPASNKEGDNIISTDEMTAFINDLQGCATNLNSNSELQMIQLQSLMSQRQTAIELTTNLVQSLGDQSEKIAENIGH